MADAVIIVDGAILTAETDSALAGVMVTTVHAGGSIFAWVEFFGTELDLLFTEGSYIVSKVERLSKLPRHS